MPVTAHLTPYQFKPGVSGNPAGRGTRRDEAWQTCDKMGFNVIEEAIKRFRDPKTPHASKDACLQLVADRLLPKLKAVEVNQASSEKLQQVMIQVIAGKVQDAVVEDSQDMLLPQAVTSLHTTVESQCDNNVVTSGIHPLSDGKQTVD